MNEPNLYIVATALAGENSVSTTHNNYVKFFSHIDNPPTLAQIQTKLTELQAEYDALQYQRDRQYPNLGEQLDMLFHDMTAGKGSKTGEWYKAIAKVKADNPKE